MIKSKLLRNCRRYYSRQENVNIVSALINVDKQYLNAGQRVCKC